MSLPPVKAEKARQVLSWCRVGHQALTNNLGPSGIVLWAGTMGLLRAVADALEKDAEPRIRTSFKHWKKAMDDANAAAGRTAKGTKLPEIYHQVIREHTNLVLHEAELAIGQSVTIGFSARRDGEPTPGVVATYSHEMRRGPFPNEHPHDLILRAIEWWEQEIEQIERTA
ncbi:hypothetical protein JMJ56_28605 [Belnapia sp. T18]|uniref:Uncharacterized protein n=1 Tax=Belnapia arida TaxID=2804533 RepID=A0ABS1UB84_9PROT|nr:hypothetical protein [Belnapia arida]MBL6081946.1 hypothetical protein [Belnapia arida]